MISHLVFAIIDGIFKFTWRIQQFIMLQLLKEHRHYQSFIRVLTIFFIVCAVLYLASHSMFMAIILAVTLYTVLMCLFCEDIYKTLSTFRGFLANGLLFATIFVLFLLTITYRIWFQGLGNSVKQLFAAYLFYVLCWMLPWLFLSSLANADVSILVNGVLTAFVGIILATFNTFAPLIVFSQAFPNINPILEPYGWSTSTMIEFTVNLLLLPIIVALACGTIVALLKKYWVDKYNNGWDIGMKALNYIKQSIGIDIKDVQNSTNNV